MDIAYNKDTLYVYLDEDLDKEAMDSLETKIDRIMDTYEIERLVVETRKENSEHIHEFEWNYNKRHKNKVVIK